MKRLLLSASLLALAQGPASAVTINVDAERLKDAVGGSMSVGGLVILVAGASGTFSGPTPGSFTSGDDLVLKKWDLSAFGMAGIFSDTTGDLQFSGMWNEGDPLRLYWYPSLNINSTAPGFGTSYGTYRDAVGLDDSALWITPAASDIINLKFFTSDATFLSAGGSNPSSAGNASFIVVPEPGAALLSIGGAIAMSFARRRRVPLR